MRIVITGGPSAEPIDQVRTLTNHSTGELAVKMAERFIDAGHAVELFLGAGSIWRIRKAKYFQTNEDLAQFLSGIQNPAEIDLVLHAAALSDFKLSEVTSSGGSGGFKENLQRCGLCSSSFGAETEIDPTSQSLVPERFFDWLEIRSGRKSGRRPAKRDSSNNNQPN